MPKRPVPPPAVETQEEYEELDVRQLNLTAEEQLKMIQLVDQAQMYGQAKREATALHERVTGQIKKLLVKADVGRSRIQVGNTPMTYYSTMRRSIKAELLLEHGVSPATINKSTVVSESWALKVGADVEV